MAVKLAFIFFSMILVNNYVLVKFLGICPFLGVSGNLKNSVGMSMAVIFVMFLATAVTWPVYTYLLVPNHLAYLNNICFILIIAVLVQLVEITLRRFVPPLYEALGIYLPLITTNCAVLGVTLLNIDTQSLIAGSGHYYTYPEALICSLGAGVGFLLAMVIFTGVRQTIAKSKPPKSFEGLPITLVAASITSLSFMGFAGLLENLFQIGV
ncbi:MAG: electron transport complex protein RnfA [Enterococcaceae bacterium]|jgi:electron transport complex protein RnfA|nr:electron transport complex protein RnfA [Enterococcaceae bacterium]MCI1919949.1 electron transport complex protein RnfA [Enterococcaceae bacterium]